MSRSAWWWSGLLVTGLLTACSHPRKASGVATPDSADSAMADPTAAIAIDPRALFAALDPYCGKAYAGRVVADEPASTDPIWQQPATMQVRVCTPEYKVLALSLGEDRSRVWVLSVGNRGLGLHHTHSHEDGTPAAVTGYGGLGESVAAPGRVEFPADEQTKAVFRANDLAVSVDNVWALELIAGKTLAYELNRPQRHFRLEFDLRTEAAAPPAPWLEAPVR